MCSAHAPFQLGFPALVRSNRTRQLGAILNPPAVSVMPPQGRSSYLGDVFSTAQAFLCLIVGRCASQHATEQKTSPMPLRLHVDTLHVQYVL